jgi:hypothetical protein
MIELVTIVVKGKFDVGARNRSAQIASVMSLTVCTFTRGRGSTTSSYCKPSRIRQKSIAMLHQAIQYLILFLTLFADAAMSAV